MRCTPRIQSRNARIWSVTMARVGSSVQLPSGWNLVWAEPTKTSGFAKMNGLMYCNDLRRSYCMRTPPSMPMEADRMATGLVANGWSAPREPVHLSRLRLAWTLLRHLVF